MMKKVIIILLTVFSSGTLFAQNDGAANTGLSFLKLGATSRAVSLGEAVVSNSEDASAVHYNPAALFLGSNVNVLFMHNEQILGIRTEYFAGKFKLDKLALGFNVNNTSVSDIQVREIPGPPQTTFTSQDIELGFSGAYKVTEALQLGLTAKFLYEKIFVDNSDGYAFDFGGLYTRDKLSIGAAFANIGHMNNLRSQSTILPSSFRMGASYLFPLQGIGATLRILADGYKILNGGIIHANGGAEFVYKDLLSIRVGYQSGYEDRNITTGIGIKYKVFNLDYAFVPYKYSLGNSHTLTLGTSF
jgi:hypothetical protein